MPTPQKVYTEQSGNSMNEMYPYLPFLRSKGRGKILEIGVCRGFSTAAFLVGVEATTGHLYSVDIDSRCGECYSHPQWTFICSDSRDVDLVRGKVGGDLDVLLIDGVHEHPTVDSDIESYTPLVKKGGVILMHDIRMPDVCEAYQKFVVDTGYVHFELDGMHEPSKLSGGDGLAWGMGVIYVR